MQSFAVVEQNITDFRTVRSNVFAFRTAPSIGEFSCLITTTELKINRDPVLRLKSMDFDKQESPPIGVAVWNMMAEAAAAYNDSTKRFAL